MAILHSDDQETPTTIELKGGKLRPASGGTAEDKERWQLVQLQFKTQRVVITSSDNNAFTLCRFPIDEPARIISELEQLVDGKREVVSFEPQEPSFELNFQRSHHDGIKVEAWIDSGNAQTGFYRWDAAGVRFFTTSQLVRDFIGELQAEFLQ